MYMRTCLKNHVVARIMQVINFHMLITLIVLAAIIVMRFAVVKPVIMEPWRGVLVDSEQAWKRAERLMEIWQGRFPDLVEWMEETLEDSLMVFTLPSEHR
jgi:hypothetical protein